MFAAVVAALAEGTGLRRCAVLTRDGGGAMRFVASQGLSEEYCRRVDGHSPWAPDCVDVQPIYCDDVHTHSATRDLGPVFDKEGIAALAFLPLSAQGQLLGKFMLYCDEPTDWARHDLSFARAVADLVATFVAREREHERLLQSRRMQSLGHLAGGIAHDFNNLLAAILGFGELLGDSQEKGSSGELAARSLLGAVGQARDLTRHLLGFARPKPLQLETVDLAALLLAEQATLQQAAGTRCPVRLLGAGVPAFVRGNADQLLQVFVNLLQNAGDASPDGGAIEVRVALRPGSLRFPTGSIEIAVADSGVGMTDAVRSRIFEPLFSTKGRGRGTGLGLCVCHGIVSHHGGEVSFATVPTRGSTFTVVLPQARPAVGGREPARAAPSAEPMRVLLVEDQAEVRQAIAMGLQAAGCDVLTAENGRRALLVLEQEVVDVVVSDVAMPEMGGIELVAALLQSRPALPVLLITGYAEVAVDLPPHVPVLQKPFTSADLRRRISALVPQRQPLV